MRALRLVRSNGLKIEGTEEFKLRAGTNEYVDPELLCKYMRREELFLKSAISLSLSLIVSGAPGGRGWSLARGPRWLAWGLAGARLPVGRPRMSLPLLVRYRLPQLLAGAGSRRRAAPGGWRRRGISPARAPR